MEEIHRKTVVPDFPKGHYDFFVFVILFLNLLNHWKYHQSNNKTEKIAPSGSIGTWKSLEQSWSTFLQSFVHPACDMKLADTPAWLEGLYVKSTTQIRSFKHKAPLKRSSVISSASCVVDWNGSPFRNTSNQWVVIILIQLVLCTNLSTESIAVLQ